MEDLTMGLWDLAKAAGSSVLNQMQAQQDEIKRYKNRLEGFDDETLKRKAQSGDKNQRYAAMMILKERGY